MDKEVKAALKRAREAIRNKEFKEALHQCKTVLKQDKNNYNALVFIGVAAEGMDEFDQALKAYTKATEISPDQLLAWQGLSGFYDKHDKPEYKEHMVVVCEKLIELQPGDEKRCFDNKYKIGQAYETMGKFEEAASIFKELVGSQSANDDVKTPIWKKLIRLLGKQKALSSEDKAVLMQAYEVVLLNGKPEDDLAQTWNGYVRLLVKGNVGAPRLITACNKMMNIHPDEAYPIEILLLIKLDGFTNTGLSLGEEDFTSLSKSLEDIKPDSPVVKIINGYLNTRRKDYVKAEAMLQSGLDDYPQTLTCWLLLIESQLALHDSTKVETSVEKAQEVSAKKDCFCTAEKNKVLQKIRINHAKALLDVGDMKSVTNSINHCQKLLNEKFQDEDVFVTLSYGHLLNGDVAHAEEIVAELGDSHSAQVLALRGWLMCHKKLYEEAMKVTQDALVLDPNNGYYHYQLGRIYWEQMKAGEETNKQECIIHLLKAAKLDLHHSETFLYLGHYYNAIANDKQRACKFYRKSYNLKTTSEEAGIALVDCLSAIGEEDTALEILTFVTSQASAGSAKWAWLRLGLHHLKFNDPSAAVTCLLSALRSDPNDNHCWECLGEAYLNRGSYTAALRTFTKAAELCPDSVYSFYQIAAIKQTLGLHTEAVIEYKNILVKSPNYVPALKGLGETQVHFARTALQEYFDKKAVDLCEEAIWNLTKAASYRPDLACLWKLLGDACTIVAPVSSETGQMKIPKKLTSPDSTLDDSLIMEKNQVLAIGAMAYGHALKVMPESSLLWHDLAVNFYRQSQNACSEQEIQEYCQKSSQALKKAISMDQNNYLFWLALGVVSLSESISDVPLAQHCFIKSIQAESNNVVAWTNLGVLYLKHDKIQLAHEALKVAQSVDPTYVQCWIGQALIAETVGDDDAMDLFRHTSSLTMHAESAIGYGSWVCAALQGTFQMEKDLYTYCIEKMAAVPTACDVMARYCDRVHTNPTAFTIYGILLERQGLLRSALKPYASAVKLLESMDNVSDLNKARSNYGRVLCSLGSTEEALKQYQAISPLENFHDVCGLALCYYKTGKLQDSFNAYTQAAELATSEQDKSHVYAALGMVSYKFKDVAGAKTALFNCSQTSQPSVPGLLALCCLGLLQSDSTLVAAVLQELNKMTETSPEIRADVMYLTATLYSMMGDPASARNVIIKQIHLYPDQADLWLLLSQHLLGHSPQDSLGVAASARTAYANDHTLKEVSAAITRGSLTAGCLGRDSSDKNSLYAAQKALHLHPHRVDYRCDMLAALFGEAVVQRCLGTDGKPMMNILMNYAKKLLQIAEENMAANPGPESTAIHLWCVKHYILALMCSGKVQQAKTMTQAALSLYKDPDLPSLLSVSNNFMMDASNIADQGPYCTKLSAEYYISNGHLDKVELLLKQAIQSSPHKKSKLAALLQFQHLAYRQILGRGNPKWSSIFMDATAEVLRIDPKCSVAHLMRGLVRFKQTGMRIAKRHFTDTLNGDQGSFGQAGRIAEGFLAEQLQS